MLPPCYYIYAGPVSKKSALAHKIYSRLNVNVNYYSSMCMGPGTCTLHHKSDLRVQSGQDDMAVLVGRLPYKIKSPTRGF